MSSDHQRQPLPPIGRRPVGPVTNMPGAAPVDGGDPRIPASGSARLLVGAHLLLLIQSALIVFSRIDLGAARTGIAAITGVSAIALVWAAIEHLRKPSRTSRRHRHDA